MYKSETRMKVWRRRAISKIELRQRIITLETACSRLHISTRRPEAEEGYTDFTDCCTVTTFHPNTSSVMPKHSKASFTGRPWLRNLSHCVASS